MKKLDKAIEAAERGETPLMVHTPKGKRGVANVMKTQSVSVHDEIVRIKNLCDPLDFLAAVVRGDMFEEIVMVVDEKTNKLKAEKTFIQPTLNQRIRTAQYLADKYMPKIGVMRHVMENTAGEPKLDTSHKSFSQMVEEASAKGRGSTTILEG